VWLCRFEQGAIWIHSLKSFVAPLYASLLWYLNAQDPFEACSFRRHDTKDPRILVPVKANQLGLPAAPGILFGPK